MDNDYFNLGTYRRDITTDSPAAQLWFDRGLLWAYAFNHFAALKCFRNAITADEQCAMAWWGFAYSRGPYYNKPWHKFDPKDLGETLRDTFEAASRASALSGRCTEKERALINALQARYPANVAPADFSTWTDAYANAMRPVYAAYPDDSDVAALFADAMMSRTPWDLWDLRTGEPRPGADTVEAVTVLETAIAARSDAGLDDHPGLLHLHIHALEMSAQPEHALDSADRLYEIAGQAGHMRHMPTHIYVQCGDYARTVSCNDAAIAADNTFVEREGALNFFALSRAHNLHFKLYGAMLLGHERAAQEAADGLLEAIPETLLRVPSPPMADWLEGYLSVRVHAMIRFGRWQALIDEPLPGDQTLYSSTTAMALYGKTIAHAVLGQIDAAEASRQAFYLATAQVQPTRTVFNNTCTSLLAIAAQMLEGELEYRMGNFDVAYSHLREAARLSDELPYDEPWGWMQPPRHALGALLAEQQRYAEAEDVYRTDLGLNETVMRACHHPDNVWALHGLHECLVQRGAADAPAVKARLDAARALSDVPIKASCLCRLETASVA